METALDTSPKKGWASSTLKVIAIITMLIDHTGATVLARMISRNPENFDVFGKLIMNPLTFGYYVMRAIGRLAFPIFIFLMIEGFTHTRSKLKYAGRLWLFALLSEIPFDWAFNLSEDAFRRGKLVEFGSQNVFFTLALGLLTIWAIDQLQNMKLEKILRWILQFGTIALGMAVAFALHTDYDAIGVFAIAVGYLGRNQTKEKRMVEIVIPLIFSSLLEMAAFVDVLFVHRYNGERGWNLKWVFYLFYPVHLMMLVGVCMLLGL